VLLGQQRSGHQHGHLLAVGHRDEGRAQRHFRLAEAHVAAHQAVHGLAGDEVLDHRVDGGLLVARLLEREAVGEGFVILRLHLERVAFARGPLGVDVEQLRGGIAHLLGRLALGLLPLPAAELVQGRGLRRGAAVAADDLQLRHRHVELVAALVLQGQELGHALAEVHVGEPQVAADAVVHVHDGVADFQLGEVAQVVLCYLPAHLLAPVARARLGGIELVLGDEGERASLRCQPVGLRDEAVGEGRHREHQRFARNEERSESVAGCWLQGVLDDVLCQRLTPP
jgi:hypothetical protein